MRRYDWKRNRNFWGGRGETELSASSEYHSDFYTRRKIKNKLEAYKKIITNLYADRF